MKGRPDMVSSTFFNGRMTAEAMKKEYKRLALMWHPDINKADNALEMMKLINAEYAYWYTRAAAADVKARKEEEQPQKDWSKYSNPVYIESLEAMIREIYNRDIDRIDGITVELIGVFIWIGGITVEMADVRKIVKDLGFQGSWKVLDSGDRAYMWKWTPEIRPFKSEPNMDTIRKNYGSQDKRRGSSSAGGYKRLNG